MAPKLPSSMTMKFARLPERPAVERVVQPPAAAHREAGGAGDARPAEGGDHPRSRTWPRPTPHWPGPRLGLSAVRWRPSPASPPTGVAWAVAAAMLTLEGGDLCDFTAETPMITAKTANSSGDHLVADRPAVPPGRRGPADGRPGEAAAPPRAGRPAPAGAAAATTGRLLPRRAADNRLRRAGRQAADDAEADPAAAGTGRGRPVGRAGPRASRAGRTGARPAAPGTGCWPVRARCCPYSAGTPGRGRIRIRPRDSPDIPAAGRTSRQAPLPIRPGTQAHKC